MIPTIYLAITCLMALIMLRIVRTDGPLKYLVIGHFVFVFLGLIIRPLILWVIQPSPEFGDAFADARLIQNGSYNQALFEIGIRTLFWIFIFGLCLELSQRILISRKQSQGTSKFNLGLTPILILLFFTLLANFIEYGGFFDSRVLTWISVSALPCVGLAVQVIFNQGFSGVHKLLMVSLIGSVALALSVMTTSKSPIMFFIFVVLLVNHISKSGKSSLRLTPRFLSLAGFMMVGGYVVFTFIQELKDGEALTSLNSEIGQKYFGRFYSLYTILKRFDLFRAVSDVWYVGEGAWYSLEEYFQIMVSSLEWNYGTEAPNFGGQWAINVLQHSSDSTFAPVVSLSQSAFAEGWLLGGLSGMVLTSLLMSGIMVCVAVMITGTLFFRLIAFYIISSNSIFEGGVVANLESLSTGVRTGIVAWLALAILMGLSQKPSRNQSEGNAS